jgi:Tfp pilus assembly protein PilX
MRRFARRIRSQVAMALPLALGIILVLAITVATVAQYTAANTRSASNSGQGLLAYRAAEQGLNDALAVLFNATDFHSASSLPSRSNVSVSQGGTYSYSAALSDPTWTITSTGTAPSKTQGGSPISRTLTRKLNITMSAASGVNTTIWNYIYSDAPAGSCLNLANNSSIATPFYIRGDLCLSNNAHIDENVAYTSSAPQLQVGGKITLAPGAYIGTSANRLNAVQTGLGCGATPHNPCTSSDNVWADSYLTTMPALTKPVIDLATWYEDASPGPKHACTTGSFPGGFDTNSVRDTSRGNVDLTPAAAYDCKVLDGTGATIGRIAWTPGSPGTLNVAGTLFFDGNLSNSQTAVYQGRATFYFNGSILIGQNLCGIASCTNSWDSSANLLVLVAGSNAQSPSFAITLNNNAQFQGAMEANGDINESNNVGVWGSVIGHQVFIANNAIDHYVPFGTPVPGQPAQTGYSESLTFATDGFGD